MRGCSGLNLADDFPLHHVNDGKGVVFGIARVGEPALRVDDDVRRFAPDFNVNRSLCVHRRNIEDKKPPALHPATLSHFRLIAGHAADHSDNEQ